MRTYRLIAVLILFFFTVGASAAFAADKNVASKNAADDRITKLEQEVDALKAEKKESVGAKFPVDFYGMIVVQPFYGTAKTIMYTDKNSTAAQSRVTDKVLGPANKNAWFSLTPQNSRIGFDWKGSKVGEKTSMGGKIELDFLNVLNNTSAGTSPIPRIRHLYLDLFGDKWSLLAGQTWDLFSPLNTHSLSLGGNLWYQGNLGFRRPQIRFTYKIPFADVNTIRFAISVNHPSNLDDLYTSGVESGMPYGEALVEYSRKMKNGDFVIAATGVAGDNRSAGKNRKTYGVAGSISIPFHKFFTVAGEIHYGQNLGNLLSYAGQVSDVKDTSGWGEITSKWCKYFETNVGYGIDNMGKNKTAAYAGVVRNQNLFANFKIFPVKAFYVGVEYNYMKTGYLGNGSSPANIIFSNLVYSF